MLYTKTVTLEDAVDLLLADETTNIDHRYNTYSFKTLLLVAVEQYTDLHKTIYELETKEDFDFERFEQDFYDCLLIYNNLSLTPNEFLSCIVESPIDETACYIMRDMKYTPSYVVPNRPVMRLIHKLLNIEY